MLVFRASLAPPSVSLFFFFNDTATTEIYTLSLHDALPISSAPITKNNRSSEANSGFSFSIVSMEKLCAGPASRRSEEHTSELQSLAYLVCRLLLEKKKKEEKSVCDVDRANLDAHQSSPISA